MKTTGKKKRQSQHDKKRQIIENKGIVAIVFFVTLLAGVFYVNRPDSEKPFDDFIAFLRSQEYTPNIGMSNLYLPGTILRNKTADPDGMERVFANPIVFAWSDKCFPQREIRESPYLFPETQGVNSASFTLGMETVGTLLPSLKISSGAVADYRLSVDDCRLISIAEVDIVRHFSESCVEGIKNSLRDGKKLEWFSVIISAIVAESFKFEIKWNSVSSVGSRLEVQEQVKQALKTAADAASAGGGIFPMRAKIELTVEDSKRTIISGTGNLIIGYHDRPLQPVYDDK